LKPLSFSSFLAGMYCELLNAVLKRFFKKFDKKLNEEKEFVASYFTKSVFKEL
jgi:hypothetical protein